jgi:OMF family outer membrane factor
MIKNFSKIGPKRWLTCFLTDLRNINKTIAFFILIAVVFGVLDNSHARERLSLPKAVELAQDHSTKIKASRSDSAAAANDYKAARARRYPSLSVSASSIYINELLEVTTFPTPLEIGSKENYQADFRISLPIFTGGKISRQIGAKNNMFLSKSFQHEAEKMASAYNCRKAFLELLRAEALANSANASMDRIEIINDNVASLHNNGLADSIDILDARLAWQQVRRLLIDRESIQGKASASLATLLGVNSLDSFEINNDIPDPAGSYPISSQALSGDDNITRPEIQSLNHVTKVTEQLIGLKRAEYFPDISAFAGYSTGKPNRDFFEKSWDDYFSLGLSLNWNINFGGQTKHEISSARHTYKSMQMAERDLYEMLTLQAKVALEDLKAAYHTYETVKSEFEIASSKYRLGRELQMSGEMTTNRLIELEAELTSAEQMYRASIIDYYLADTEYLYAIGSPKIHGGL